MISLLGKKEIQQKLKYAEFNSIYLFIFKMCTRYVLFLIAFFFLKKIEIGLHYL